MSGHRLELIPKDAPVGTRVLVLPRGGVDVDEPRVDYTRALPYEDPLYGWFVSVGRSLLDSHYFNLSCVYALPNSALEREP